MKRRTVKPYSTYQEFKEWCFNLLGNKCTVCESEINLEIDHIHRKLKSFNVSKAWATTNTDLLKDELKKCQTLCKSCHKEKTISEFKIDKIREINHGTKYAWMKRKCQCPVCNNSKRAWHDKRNEKRSSARQDVTRSAPLGRRSFLLWPPLRVSAEGRVAKKNLFRFYVFHGID